MPFTPRGKSTWIPRLYPSLQKSRKQSFFMMISIIILKNGQEKVNLELFSDGAFPEKLMFAFLLSEGTPITLYKNGNLFPTQSGVIQLEDYVENHVCDVKFRGSRKSYFWI